MNYDQFDKNTLKILRSAMQKALDEAGLGNLEFNVGNMKYSSAEVKIQITAKIEGKKTITDVMLEEQIRVHNLKREVGGRVLVEFKPSNHKYPFIFEQNGKRYKCSTMQAKAYFAA